VEPLARYPIFQYAWVVNDIDEGCRRWHEMTGAGPFFVTRFHKAKDHIDHGQPFHGGLSYAFGYAGETQVQLIQVHDDTPSIYRDMFAPGEEGFHHVAMLVPDPPWAEKARYEAAGYPSVSELWATAYVCYIDTRAAIGCYTELHGDTPEIREVFRGWKEAHDTWDGKTDVIRERRSSR
jgi:hypothetical protein